MAHAPRSRTILLPGLALVVGFRWFRCQRKPILAEFDISVFSALSRQLAPPSLIALLENILRPRLPSGTLRVQEEAAEPIRRRRRGCPPLGSIEHMPQWQLLLSMQCLLMGAASARF